MASPGYSHYSRFLFPDMFSFSLDPEILSFLWTSSSPRDDIDSVLRYHLTHPSQLLHILFSPESQEATFLSTLYNTIVTSGILIVVGAGSYSTFRLLQCIRKGLSAPALDTAKVLAAYLTKPFILHWRKFRGGDLSHSSTPDHIGHGLTGSQLHKRPSELRIVANGSPRGGNNGNGFRHGRESSLERRLLIKDPTPLADCDIASGEEGLGEIQGQYFGPTARSEKFCMDLLGSSSDDSPTLSPYKQERKKRSPNKGKGLGAESSC